MSRQIQLRRGTTAEHENFTGAIGEVTVDTTTNTLRVHDGQTVGGTALARADSVTDMTGTDYVIAWQHPTSENNYTWFRKYRSGWVEQGGKVFIDIPTTTISLPVAMAGTDYTVLATAYSYSSSEFHPAIINIRRDDSLTATSFKLMAKNHSAISYGTNGFWMVCGLSAE